MLRIKNIKALSTGLSAAFAKIQSIDVEDIPFGIGGFGEVYHCLQINGKQVAEKQVVKIFIDNGNGSAQKGFKTIQKLQLKLKAKQSLVRQNLNRDLINVYPALKGVPQFSFTGLFKGALVLGYSAHNLLSLGFIEFKDILEDKQLNRDYQQLPLIDKMLIAYNLVSAFNILKDLLYIHADFKAEAVFINLKTRECAIIDFDSGAVIVNQADKPSTWGTRQDWLAPEINKQLAQFSNNQGSVKVDLWSDAWSVIIGVHYLLFLCHPFFYLSELSERSMSAYFNKFEWPNVDPKFSYFSNNHQHVYLKYKNFVLKVLPENIRDKLAHSINKGYALPSTRASYGALKTVLKTTQSPPLIELFETSGNYFDGVNPITIRWKTKRANNVSINNKTVKFNGIITVKPIMETIFSLTADNNFGKIKKQIKIGILNKLPIIQKFHAHKSLLTDSTPAQLSWQIQNATRLFIDHGIGDVTLKNHVMVTPRQDTIYELTAVNYFGKKVSKKIKLTVSKVAPDIKYFKTSKSILTDKTPALLSWEITGAYKILINQGVGDVTNRKSTEIFSLKDITYTLTAISYFGVKSNAVVKVFVSKDCPSVNFQTSAVFIQSGQSVELYWKVERANSVEISPKLGQVPFEGRKMIKLLKTCKFVLTAKSIFGHKTQSTISIQVLTVVSLKMEDKLKINSKMEVPSIKLQIDTAPKRLHTNLNISIPKLNFSKK